MDDASDRPEHVTLSTAGTMILLWLSQPPLAIWPLAMVALVPLLDRIVTGGVMPRRTLLKIAGIATAYWLVSLQGLRHAHPAMHLAWIALSGYLSLYTVGFVIISGRLIRRGVPAMLSAPLAWVACELVRNYFATGISAIMLGHALADVPVMIQIADLGGSYVVSAVVVIVNVAVLSVFRTLRGRSSWRTGIGNFAAASLVVAMTLGYGWLQLSHARGEPLATFALLQRNERVEYGQSPRRDAEIFDAYARHAIRIVGSADRTVDAVVWPESMFSGGVPWPIADPELAVPADAGISVAEMREGIEQQQTLIRRRARSIGNLIANRRLDPAAGRAIPHLIAGAGVIRYGREPQGYSAVLHFDPDGDDPRWYGKTHLVMFGEYIPLLGSIPVLRDWMPPGLGLATGPGPKVFRVGETRVAANICIETAVERVSVNQMRQLLREGEGMATGLPDAIVTVTNDGWFRDSSVIDHHLRCAQLVAVGCRRPILSAANNGPTAWIDSSGRVRAAAGKGDNDAVIATPRRDERVSVYVRYGAAPAWLALAVTIVLASRRRSRTSGSA